MPNTQSSGSGRARSGSQLSRVLGQRPSQSSMDASEHVVPQETEDRPSSFFHSRPESSPSRMSFSSSMNQKTPARSYFQHSVYGSHNGEGPVWSNDSTHADFPIAPVDITRSASQGVREDTAELASWALSDIASSRSEHSPARHHTSSITHQRTSSPSIGLPEQEDPSGRISNDSSRPNVIEEVSEPSSPQSSHSSRASLHTSALTKMIRNSPPTEDDSQDTDGEEAYITAGVYPVTVGEGIISQPSERTSLLKKRTAYGSVKDLECQKSDGIDGPTTFSIAVRQCRENTARLIRKATTPKSWNRQDIWHYGFRQPLGCIPPVILGLLLNILDALSYGETEPQRS